MGFRWLGIALVMVGSICSGIWYRIRYLGRLANLRECQRALSVLRGEIQYGRTPLTEACREVEDRVSGVCRQFFRNVAEKLEQGAGSLDNVWKENTSLLFSSLHMGTKEREEWMRLGSTMGYLDVEMQLRTMDLYLQRLQTSIDQADRECRNRSRLYPLLGTFGGVLICLVLV